MKNKLYAILTTAAMMMIHNNGNAGDTSVLSEGIRGKKWGEVIREAPSKICEKNSSGWICKETLGSAEVGVMYITLKDGRLAGASIVDPTKSSCATIYRAAETAWGRGAKASYEAYASNQPSPTTWASTTAMAMYSSDKESCAITAFNLGLIGDLKAEDNAMLKSNGL
jgi:hypothetical protein